MWLEESNRDKHLKLAILPGFLFTILFVAGLATGMEYKDHLTGGKYDWLDWAATMIGGAIGQGLQLLTIWMISYIF